MIYLIRNAPDCRKPNHELIRGVFVSLKQTFNVGLRSSPHALFVHKQAQQIEIMRSATFTVRVDAAAKKRLERLAKSTGRNRSFIVAEAINEYLDVNEWQVAGIRQAIASLDRGEGVPHARVKDWITSWGSGSTLSPWTVPST
jgi:RHH-type transcriptional regulator, rel operon repressor / antitoxin RelB